ncbi:MAG: hypothetical protein WC699_16830 [Bacteroidales bacterium]|jgi:hypothetical protein
MNRDLKDTIYVLRELIRTVRLNLEVLELLRLNGRISETDKQYLEIIRVNRRNIRSMDEFLLETIPALIDANPESGQKFLKKSFRDWSAELAVSLGYLNRLIKDFISPLAKADQMSDSGFNDLIIKDKRFWPFLDNAGNESILFTSFEEKQSGDSQETPDPEEGKTEDQGKEE